MIMIILYSSLYILFIFIDLIPAYKNKQNKLFWIYSILLAFSYVILILISLDVKIPSPSPLIKKVVSTIFNL